MTQLRRDITAAVLRTLNRSTKHDRRLARMILLAVAVLAGQQVWKMMT